MNASVRRYKVYNPVIEKPSTEPLIYSRTETEPDRHFIYGTDGSIPCPWSRDLHGLIRQRTVKSIRRPYCIFLRLQRNDPPAKVCYYIAMSTIYALILKTARLYKIPVTFWSSSRINFSFFLFGKHLIQYEGQKLTRSGTNSCKWFMVRWCARCRRTFHNISGCLLYYINHS